MFNFLEQILIIDYGSTTIKGIVLKGRGDDISVLKTAVMPILNFQELNQIENGLQEKLTYEYNLLRFLQSYFPEEKNCIVNLPLEKTYVRDLNIPVTDMQQIQDIIPHEVESLLPLSLEEAEVIGHAWEINDENSRVLSFTSRFTSLEESVNPLRKERINLRMLAPDSAALSGMIQLLRPDEYENKTVAQLDIGGKTSILNILKNGELIFTRKLIIGMGSVIEFITNKFGLSDFDSHQILSDINLNSVGKKISDTEIIKKYKLKASDLKELKDYLTLKLDDVVEEIERSILTLQEADPEIFYLSGGGAMINGTLDFLSEKLGKKIFEYPFYLCEDLSINIWATAVGTYFHYLLPRDHRFDFLESPFGNTLRGSEFNIGTFAVPLGLSAASVIFVLISFFVGLWTDNKEIKLYGDEIRRIASGIPGVNVEEGIDEIISDAKKICNEKLGGQQDSITGVSILDTLQVITEKMPSQEELYFSLQNFQYSDNSFEFEADVDNYDKIVEIQKQMETISTFSEVQVKQQKKIPGDKIRFTIKLILKKGQETLRGKCR